MPGVPWKRWIVVLLTLAVLAALVVRRSGCSYRQRRPRAQSLRSAERAPCKVEMPGYQDLQNRYGDRGLVAIGIALDTNRASVVRFAREHRIRYTLSSPEIQEKFGGILGLPTTILVDRQGLIRKKVVGFEYKEAFETAVLEIL